MSSYKALYRKYRPATFDEVVGQKHIVKTLRNEIRLSHISHAYLFTGPRGTGKTSIARIFAKSINCLNPYEGESCGECDICKAINEGSNTDIIEIDAASQTRVDNIREIIDKVPYHPSMSKYKVYIIDEVHMLSSSSFNALLKTLEEPPQHAIFILCTTEVEKVIPTIISRCQKFDFHLIDKDEIEQRLKTVVSEENINIEDEAIGLIAENAGGGMRDALSILDQVSALSLEDKITKEDVLEVTGTLSIDSMNKLALSISSSNGTEAINIMEDLMSLGKEAEKIASSLITYFKDMLVIKNTSKVINKVGYTKDEFKEVLDALSNQYIFRYIDILSEALKNIKQTLDKKMYLELALLKMCDNVSDSKKTEVKQESPVSGYNPNITYAPPSFVKEEPVAPKVQEVKEEVKPSIPETKEPEDLFASLFNDDKPQVPEVKADPIVETKTEPVVEQKEEVKETIVSEPVQNDDEYDITFIEQVLNKADKAFKEEVIFNLPQAIKETKGTSYQKYAQLLDGCELVAASRDKAIIVFAEIGHCNLLMKEDNYKGIQSFFKDYMNFYLEFVAIPANLWKTLSSEFIQRMHAGLPKGSITLTKVRCPGLKAVKGKRSNESDDKFKGVEEIFGDILTIK